MHDVSTAAIRFLYIFAGLPRKGDVSHALRELTAKLRLSLTVEEFDIERGQDVLSDSVWLPLMRRVKHGEFTHILCSPPCHTWSRAPWSNNAGPKPLRSAEWLEGFPWLRGLDKKKVDQGAELIRRTLQVIQLAHEVGVPWLIEHPEDLGPTPRGTPASIWTWETSRTVFNRLQASAVALFQCAFGSDFRKPTRLAGTWHNLPQLGFSGWPKVRNWTPDKCGHQHPPLTGQLPDKNFQNCSYCCLWPWSVPRIGILLAGDAFPCLVNGGALNVLDRKTVEVRAAAPIMDANHAISRHSSCGCLSRFWQMMSSNTIESGIPSLSPLVFTPCAMPLWGFDRIASLFRLFQSSSADS